jgi:hypothetical protein
MRPTLVSRRRESRFCYAFGRPRTSSIPNPTVEDIDAQADSHKGASKMFHIVFGGRGQILLANSVRASFTCFQFCATQSTRPCIGRNRLRPRVVSSYSTRRGTSGNNSLVSSPSLSRFRSVSVSILWEMPGIARSSSENRARPPGNFYPMAKRPLKHSLFERKNYARPHYSGCQRCRTFAGLL